MVDSRTYEKLTSEEKAEYNKLSSSFRHSVFKSAAIDGLAFQSIYEVKEFKGFWFVGIAGSDSDAAFAAIKSESKSVIKALFKDAVQNYGR